VSDERLKQLAASEVQQYFNFQYLYLFQPSWMMIVTWDGVTFNGGSSSSAVNKSLDYI
jgi:hypothetical protein